MKECEKQLADAEDCFKQCDIEIRMLPSSIKASVVQKVDTLRKECESKRRQLANMKVQVERNDLLGGAAVSFSLYNQLIASFLLWTVLRIRFGFQIHVVGFS